MTLRILKRTILSLVALLLLSACSIKTVYNNLDWVLEGMVDDYIDLTDTQEEDVDERITQLLKWHKETQLAEYVNDLKEIKIFTAKGIDDESAEIIFAKFMERWTSMKKKVAPEMAALFLMLNNKQIKALFVRLEEENKEIEEEYKQTTEEEKIIEGGAKLVENFSDWLGPLNEEQKALLISWPSRFQSTHENRLVFRAKWQAALKRVLKGDISTEEKRTRLIALTEKPEDYQSEQYKAQLVHNSKQVKALILTFGPTVTDEQKIYLSERLDYFIRNFEELIEETKQK